MSGSQILAILVASLAEFAVGAIWYMPLFGGVWGKIHCFDQLSKKEQKALQAQMGPYYLGQLLVTVVTTVVLFKAIMLLPEYSPYMIAFALWLGFVVPTQVSAVIFGGTEGKWITTKIAIMAGGSLACLFAATAVFGFF